MSATKTDYQGMITEITAKKLLFGPEDDYKKGHNDAMDKALTTVRNYEKGEGLFQSQKTGLEQVPASPSYSGVDAVRVSSKELFYFLTSPDKPFKVNEVRTWFNEYYKEQISLPRLAEKMNEKVFYYIKNKVMPEQNNDNLLSNFLKNDNPIMAECTCKETDKNHRLCPVCDKEEFEKSAAINVTALLNKTDIADNVIHLLKENLQCVHDYLDGKLTPRKDSYGKEYSIVGRIKFLEKYCYNPMIIKSDNICPKTNKPCDDECCPVGAVCNLDNGHEITVSPTASPLPESVEVKSYKAIADLNHVIVNACMNAMAITKDVSIGDELTKILEQVRLFTSQFKYTGEKIAVEGKSKEELIKYMYDFAWYYGRLYHIGDAGKIKEAIKEKFQLPEEFLEQHTTAIVEEPDPADMIENYGPNAEPNWHKKSSQFRTQPSNKEVEIGLLKNDGLVADIMEAYPNAPIVQEVEDMAEAFPKK